MMTSMSWNWFLNAVLLALSLALSTNVAEASSFTNTVSDDRMLLVIAVPSIDDAYYHDAFQGILEFDIQYANAVMGHDNIIVLADTQTMPYLQERLPADIVLEADVRDIWLRDFALVHPERMVQFRYDRPDEPDIQESFTQFAQTYAVTFSRSTLNVDGGNVVDNGAGTVILTDKVFARNAHVPEDAVLMELEEALDTTDIAILPMDDEFLGHSDGMVMFLDAKTVLVTTYPDDPAFTHEVLTNLSTALPNIDIVTLKGSGYGEPYGQYASACGIYVNAVVTHKYIYAPVFGTVHDVAAVETIRRHTEKTVITINAENVCYLGGNVRCLSWQLTGENARKLIEAARRH